MNLYACDNCGAIGSHVVPCGVCGEKCCTLCRNEHEHAARERQGATGARSYKGKPRERETER